MIPDDVSLETEQLGKNQNTSMTKSMQFHHQKR